MRVPADRLVWLLAWGIIERVQRGIPDLQLVEFVDPIDGRSLRLSHGDHPCELVLNQRTGVSLLAPIVFEIVAWHQVAAQPLDQFARLLRQSLAWSSRRDDVDPTGPALARAILARLLSLTWADNHEWWIGSLAADSAEESAPFGTDLPTLAQQLAKRWEPTGLSGHDPSPAEVWLLHRDHELVAAFDDDAGIHMRTARWSYADVHQELARDPAATAFYCVQTIRAVS